MLKKLSGIPYGPALIVLASILWALDGVVRRSLFSLPPITIVFFEHLIGLLILAPFFIPRLKKEALNLKELGLMSFVALLSGVLGTLWFTMALVSVNFIPFSIVYLILYLEPLFAITTAHFLLKEKVTSKFLSWGALALVAAYFATFKDGAVNLATGSGTLTAALYALGATAAWGISTAFSKKFLVKKSDVVATGVRFSLTTVFALIGVLIMGQSASLTQPTVDQYGRFLFIALSTGMVALWIYYRGLKRTEAKITTMLELVFPILAISIDAVLYKTFLAPTQYFAAGVMMFAIYNIAKLQKEKA
jgi:drug/metabolite transporter (DMT)-like permease